MAEQPASLDSLACCQSTGSEAIVHRRAELEESIIAEELDTHVDISISTCLAP